MSSACISGESGAAPVRQDRTLERSYFFVSGFYVHTVDVQTPSTSASALVLRLARLRGERRTLHSNTAWAGTMLPTESFACGIITYQRRGMGRAHVKWVIR